MTLFDRDSHLHGGKISYTVKFKHDFNKSTGEAVVVPSHIVIPWPSIVDMAQSKIIFPTNTIGQLA